MEGFIENFQKFRDFLNSESTEYMLSSMLKDGNIALKVIKDKFEELGLNNTF